MKNAFDDKSAADAELLADLLSLPKDQQDDFRERLSQRAEEYRREQTKEMPL
jgi:hypothetical protein